MPANELEPTSTSPDTPRTEDVLHLDFTDGTQAVVKVSAARPVVQFERLKGHSPTGIEDILRVAAISLNVPGGDDGFEEWIDTVDGFRLESRERPGKASS